MDIIQLMPRLHFLRLPVGQAYLWHDPDELTLIDAGLPGSAPLIAEPAQGGRRNQGAAPD
jgi:glyoxylase-like metal-dependent hydrolase (beta-lactamase superfamily II)